MADKSPGTEAKLDAASGRTIVYEEIYDQLFHDLITGQLAPGLSLTVRGLARRLKVSPMPVREAVKRLVAQGALELTETRRISVAPMTPEKFDEICAGRTLLEPELAARAMPNFLPGDLETLREWDLSVDAAIAAGDPNAYGRANWGFHSFLYRKAGMPTLYGLVEPLWLQVGAFMRQLAGRFGTANLQDQHHVAIDALSRGDEAMLRKAIRQDILDGMNLIRD